MWVIVSSYGSCGQVVQQLSEDDNILRLSKNAKTVVDELARRSFVAI